MSKIDACETSKILDKGAIGANTVIKLIMDEKQKNISDDYNFPSSSKVLKIIKLPFKLNARQAFQRIFANSSGWGIPYIDKMSGL